jgi:2-hydroxychromene-2-carboxylate isomerase
MGDVISLTDRRRQQAAATPSRRPGNRFARTVFSFDLLVPQTYLAAERVEKLFDGVRWQPAYAEIIHGGRPPLDRLLPEARERADALGVPLVLPEPYPTDVRPAMRAAALACDMGQGASFVLAAGRLAFCGGFDLGDPEVLAEAAAAAGIPLDLCLSAAGDLGRDGVIEETSRRLLAAGADALPVLRVGRTLFGGEDRIAEAAAAAGAPANPRAPRPASA